MKNKYKTNVDRNMKKILHVMEVLPDKFNSKYIKFANSELNHLDHTFISFKSREHSPEQRTSKGRGRLSIIKALLSKKYDLVVFHGFFYGTDFVWLYFIMTFTTLKKRSFWMTLGGDIYTFRVEGKPFKQKVKQLIKAKTLSKVRFVGAQISGEADIVRKHYNDNAIHFKVFYPDPIGYSDEKLPKRTNNVTCKVMVGNSADPSNEHLKVFSELLRFGDNISIFCSLAYGPEEYKLKVIKEGKSLFGKRFSYQDKMVPPNEYRQILADIDVAIFYHDRQQAMGNIFQLLYLGKKVFVRSDTTSYLYLKNLKLPIHDALSINNINVSELQHYDVDISYIKNKLQNENSASQCKLLWSNMFDELLPIVAMNK